MAGRMYPPGPSPSPLTPKHAGPPPPLRDQRLDLVLTLVALPLPNVCEKPRRFVALWSNDPRQE